MTGKVELRLDDPRLQGWRPVTRHFVAVDLHCSVMAIQDHEAGKGVLDARPLKTVTVRTENPTIRGFFVLDYERDLGLGDLGDAMDYARRVATDEPDQSIRLGVERLPQAPDENRVHQGRHFSADGGPGFSREELYAAAALEKCLYLFETGMTDVRDVGDSILAQVRGEPSVSQPATVPMLQRAALRAAQLAYQLGRITREGEIAAAHEVQADTGSKVLENVRVAGERRGENLRETANAWRTEFLNWLQDEVNKANASLPSPMTLDGVLDLAIQNWPKDGCGTQKVLPPRSTLKAAIDWGRKQQPPLFVRPSAPKGRRKGIV